MAYKTRSRTQSKQSRKNKSRSQSRGGSRRRSSSSQSKLRNPRNTRTTKARSVPSDWKPSRQPIYDYKKVYPMNLNKSVYTNKY